MKMLPWSFLAAIVICTVSLVQSEPTWTSLRVTWGLNVLSSRVFAKLPYTENKARSDGFARLAGPCNGKFLGHRYIKGLDTTAVLIYDAKGYIAGIQHGIPKNDAVGTFDFQKSAYFAEDKIFGEEEVYFVTTYFVDPSIICNGGRTKEQYDEQGIGTGLFVQTGSNPLKDTLEVPLYENATQSNQWEQGGCFRTMGVHYWLETHANMSCSNFFPVTGIYNRGKLTSFAFVTPGRYEFSRRFEHPTSSVFSAFLPSPVPKCLYDLYDESGGFSSMHVFFSVRPWNILC